MKRLALLLLPLSALFFYSCKNRQLAGGQLKNLSGLDGCGWIIELDHADKDGNKKLEPSNLAAFKITLREGQPVKLRYNETHNMSACMAGKPVELQLIRDK